ncbi:hypothetical protein PUN28_009246 [Cardiocondyla obscurior]|uniref:Uncharacterized protein n=1 Tax=Cardiocondyla obscurior TaxID=286306 RepID=A0AAW2FTG7_9HYME
MNLHSISNRPCQMILRATGEINTADLFPSLYYVASSVQISSSFRNIADGAPTIWALTRERSTTWTAKGRGAGKGKSVDGPRDRSTTPSMTFPSFLSVRPPRFESTIVHQPEFLRESQRRSESTDKRKEERFEPVMKMQIAKNKSLVDEGPNERLYLLLQTKSYKTERPECACKALLIRAS